MPFVRTLVALGWSVLALAALADTIAPPPVLLAGRPAENLSALISGKSVPFIAWTQVRALLLAPHVDPKAVIAALAPELKRFPGRTSDAFLRSRHILIVQAASGGALPEAKLAVLSSQFGLGIGRPVHLVPVRNPEAYRVLLSRVSVRAKNGVSQEEISRALSHAWQSPSGKTITGHIAGERSNFGESFHEYQLAPTDPSLDGFEFLAFVRQALDGELVEPELTRPDFSTAIASR